MHKSCPGGWVDAKVLEILLKGWKKIMKLSKLSFWRDVPDGGAMYFFAPPNFERRAPFNELYRACGSFLLLGAPSSQGNVTWSTKIASSRGNSEFFRLHSYAV
mmetsp:Transcript_41543/g.76786  ORF Transcript_41543/g.76786 Transcript_41543/m.76786 type:complete len:103 (-) Transcript_41543:667-975(-)